MCARFRPVNDLRGVSVQEVKDVEFVSELPVAFLSEDPLRLMWSVMTLVGKFAPTPWYGPVVL
jgi:hypothetical protein